MIYIILTAKIVIVPQYSLHVFRYNFFFHTFYKSLFMSLFRRIFLKEFVYLIKELSNTQNRKEEYFNPV